MTLGKRIKHFRHLRGFSLLELEKRTGIKREYLCRIETNALPNPTYKTMQLITKGLQIELIELFESPPSPPPTIKLLSAAQLNTEPKLGNLVAIPIVSQQLVHQQPLSLSTHETEDYALLGPSLIPQITKVGAYRALYLDEDDSSMSPVISPGSLICVDFGPQDIPQLLSKLVLMKDEEGRCRVGYLRVEGDFIIGIPHNIRHYNPIIIPREREDSVLGRVVGCFNCISHA